ncbi:MAG: outer membrane beta-barrel protein [Bacteroidales bacterium]
MLKSIKLVLICFSIFGINLVYSQNTNPQNLKYQVKAVVTDSITGKPIEFASFSIINSKTQKMVDGGITNAKGVFLIENVNKGKYQIIISYVGYSAYKSLLVLEGSNLIKNLGIIQLSKKNIELNTTEIKGQAIPFQIKEDTVEFSASSFQTDSNAVVEDLLKKLPGVEVDKDGKITAYGKEVTKVFVDGKPFFGNDTKTATRNLPVDMIDKIQIMDRKSDQSMFTQIDDGDVEKVLNLVVKPGRKNGVFGKATFGVGTEDRYDGSGMINWFEGARQVSIIGTANNINNLRFSDFVSMDQNSKLSGSINFLMKGGASNGSRFFGGRGGSNVPGLNANGINSSWSAGANFRDSIGNKISFTGSYMFTASENTKEQNSSRQNFLKDSTFNYDNTANNKSSNYNHNINMEFDYRIDSMNSILFIPKIRITNSSSEDKGVFNSYGKSGIDFNYGNSQSIRDNQSISLSGEMLVRHRFSKKRRTISLSVKPGYKSTNSDGIDISNSYYRIFNNLLNDSIDQQKKSSSNEKSLETRLSYTEPLTDRMILELNYNFTINNSSSDRKALNYSPVSNDYLTLDSTYTNQYENTFINHRAGINIRIFRNLWDYTIGIGVEPSLIRSNSISKSTILEQNVVNFSPSLNINYKPKKGKSLRIRYRGTTNQPSLSQLQPIPDNSNPQYIINGNPNLKPEFNNNLNINYNGMDFASMNFIFAGIMLDNSINKIANQNTYDSLGRQNILPKNVNGYYAINAFTGFGKPIKKFIINLTGNAGFSNDVNYSNNSTYTTQNLILGINTRINYNGSKITAAPIAKVNYTKAKYSLAQLSNTEYVNYTLGFDFQLDLPLNFKIGSDFQYIANTGYGSGYNLTSKNWNAFISKQIFKNKKGQLKLQVYDILEDNKSVYRTTSENYIEDGQVNALSRFFMLSFSYSFSKFNGKEPERRDRMMGMPMGGRRGGDDF